MSRRRKNNWKQDKREELRKAVRNFNDKIRRLEKKDPKNKAALPEKVKLKELESLLETKHDFNREINSLRRFSERGAEKLVKMPNNAYDSVKITKWQRDDMRRRKRTINRNRKKRKELIESIEMESRGEKLGYTKAQMGKISERELDPIKDFTPHMDHQDRREKFRVMLRESQNNYWKNRDDIMKQAYIKSLENNFNPNEIVDIIDAIDDTPTDAFRRIYEANGGNFERNYPMNEEQRVQAMTELRSIWIPNRKG